ncbi:hypothetical protein ACOSQ2_017695 [Xanthoceras sorbifolium]
MAMNPKSSFLNPKFPSLNSDFNPTHVTMINSHQMVHGHSTIPSFNHQNCSISESSHLGSIGLGQLGLSQIITEVRRTCILPNRVKVHSFINYEFPMQNQIALPPNNLIRGSEFLRTPSTIERFLAPRNNLFHTQTGFISNGATTAHHVEGLIANNNSTTANQGQPNLQNQMPRVKNQGNYRLAEIESNRYPYQLQNQTITTPRSMIYASLINGRNLNLEQNPSLDQLGIMNLQYPNLGKPSTHQTSHTNNNNFEDDHRYDGRTHSLPYKKYGPYNCPRCKGVFPSSQAFAGHMWSHYKYESSAERKRRLAARNKKKNKLHLVPNSRRTQ